MSEPSPSESSAGTRERLEQELSELREHREQMAAALGGEDPEDTDADSRGDAATELEGLDAIGRVDRRITELEHLIAGPDLPPPPDGIPDGTSVTLRFADGEVASFTVVAIAQELPGDEQDEILTTDSPLGQALAGHRVGDTITYSGPDGDARAEVLAMDAPTS